MILNTVPISTKEQILFLGPNLGIQRYDKFKHKIFYDLFKRQLELFWRPEEISLLKDKVDYEKLAPHEKHIFTSNLKFQTMLDSVVARGVPVFAKYISSPELEACFNAWQLFETIHSYAYTYIIKNLYSDPNQIFDDILLNEEILKRAYSVSNMYDKLNEDNGHDLFTLKKKIYLSLISVNILEAVRFYVSFVCAFAFAENKKMVGNADIIKLIKRDEAVHLFITQNIINILRNNSDEGFIETIKECENEAINMFAAAVEEEKAWANYLFKDGSILGLNEKILHNYIEWLADSRMSTIGLPKIYNAKNNGLGTWVDAWMESTAIQVAPQESEILSYKIGASKNDLDDMDLTEFKL